MDFDIEMEDASGQYQEEVPQEMAPQEDILAIDADDQEPGEIGDDDGRPRAAGEGSVDVDLDDVAGTVLVPTKVHVRGLDALNPDDIKAYVAEHAGSDGGGGGGPFDRIEWIDDTSANLVFASDTAAAAALVALAAVPVDDVAQLAPGELLPAKTYAAKPDAVSAGLSVRMAVASDKKQAGAAARSRFYLLHPEYDPEERRRNAPPRRRGGRNDRDGYSYRDDRRSGRRSSYRDSRRDSRQDDRDSDIRNNSFDVRLYDDEAPAPRSSDRRRRRSWSRSRSRSWSPSRSRSPVRIRRENNRDKELFPAVQSTRGKELFPEMLGGGRDAAARETATRRTGRDRDTASGRLGDASASPSSGNGGGFYYDEGGDYDGRLADEQAEAAAAAASRDRNVARATKDRLAGKELFPSRSGSTAQMDLLDSTRAVTAKLSDRITRPSDKTQSSFLNIRGQASQQSGQQQGISIKGAASARELFPAKLSGSGRHGGNDNNDGSGGGRAGHNSGKEIFDNSLASRIRPRPRQRAEDLFH